MFFSKRNSSDDKLKRYLLGDLPESQREIIEQRMLTDSAFYEEVLATEDDLVDQYVSGTLTDEERRQFESYFSVSKDRRPKIQFGHALRHYIDSVSDTEPQQTVITNSTLKRSVFSGWLRHAPIAASLVAALFVSALVLSWAIYKRQTQPSTGGQFAIITLAPGAVRSEGNLQRITQPPANSSIQVKLQLGTNEYRTYRVELFREDEVITTVDQLTAQNEGGHFVMSMTLGSNLLKPGDYRARLEGILDDGLPEFKDQYRFRVIP